MSSIQFNLLPDVKTKYISAERNRRSLSAVAIITALASIALLILMFLRVDVVQKKQLSDADKQVSTAQDQLKSIDGLDKIITVQNQLQTLSTLHQSLHAPTRVFTYLPQLTPSTASIGNMTLDMAANTIQVNGTADSQATINAFVDTLKYATYKANQSDSEHPAFNNVILNGFAITPGKASYSISASFDGALFTNASGPAPILIIKNQVTTRSVQGDPNSVFNGQAATGKTGGK
jgi:Tfp pilus assembly protein PilN